MRLAAISAICLLCSCTPSKSGLNQSAFPDVNRLVRPAQQELLKGLVAEPTAKGFNHLVIFGDSMSDPGQLHRRTLGLFLPPSVFYHSMFSNGPIWSDYVGAALAGWTVSNFAVGGAKTSDNSLVSRVFLPSMLEQMRAQEKELSGLPRESTIVVIWIGPNNYLTTGEIFQDPSSQLLLPKLAEHVEKAIEDIKKGIEKLKALGFRRILLGTMPELGVLADNPREPRKTTAESLFAATRLHNASLLAFVNSLERTDRWNVGIFHSGEINQATLDAPSEWGFTRLDRPCYFGSLKGEFYGEKKFCDDPSGYKFWEFNHPNSKMHCFYASRFLLDLASESIIPKFSFDSSLKRCKTL